MQPPIPDPETPAQAKRDIWFVFRQVLKWLPLILLMGLFMARLIAWLMADVFLSDFYFEIKKP